MGNTDSSIRNCLHDLCNFFVNAKLIRSWVLFCFVLETGNHFKAPALLLELKVKSHVTMCRLLRGTYSLTSRSSFRSEASASLALPQLCSFAHTGTLSGRLLSPPAVTTRPYRSGAAQVTKHFESGLSLLSIQPNTAHQKQQPHA